MSATASTAHADNTSRMSWFLKVWVMLLALTAIEVFLAYEDLPLHTMLVLLMGISIIKAAMIIAYFMHLRYERSNLAWTLLPAMVFVLGMMVVFFPDSIRVEHLGQFLR
jgi:cytochrome c oxidase subunit IV